MLVSEEQGAQHGAYLFEDDWRCETNRGGQSWRNLAVVLPKFGSTTDENPEGTSGVALRTGWPSACMVMLVCHLCE